MKTTGCEAMFIHAVPGLPAREVFIYRPYDKATVWEQREVLSLARRLGVRVFLWECMALQPDLVNLLQSQWMRDDCSTITNAYPDHEDVQGPTGFDVATAISEFVPLHGKLLTAEDQMLPVMKEHARLRGTTVGVVSARDAELVSDDLLGRFGYPEHPKNVMLAAAVGRAFGISTTVAICEMADNVVPDLGVLKTYPTVPWSGRTLSFTNGMGANDRAGTLANWQRSGFGAHDPDHAPQRWIVTVVNNRADRVARSEVFAKVLVQDVAAHRHVLIGTNVRGLLGFIQEALDSHLDAIALSRDLPTATDQRREVVSNRIDRAFARLKVQRTDAQSVLTECQALGFPPVDSALVQRLLHPVPGESYEAASDAVRKAVAAECDDERLAFLVAAIARRRIVRAVHAHAAESLEANPKAVDAAFRAAYRAFFLESVVPLHDADLSGDAIIDRIASAVPPGAQASVMGIQNIKGTGLDFVYRWVSIDMVHRMLNGLQSSARDTREGALVQLLIHHDYGMIDATLASEAVGRARDLDPDAATFPTMQPSSACARS